MALQQLELIQTQHSASQSKAKKAKTAADPRTAWSKVRATWRQPTPERHVLFLLFIFRLTLLCCSISRAPALAALDERRQMWLPWYAPRPCACCCTTVSRCGCHPDPVCAFSSLPLFLVPQRKAQEKEAAQDQDIVACFHDLISNLRSFQSSGYAPGENIKGINIRAPRSHLAVHLALHASPLTRTLSQVGSRASLEVCPPFPLLFLPLPFHL
jgi:hypothetical protein